MKLQHTPGPWYLAYNGERGFLVETMIEKGQMVICQRSTGSNQDEANARLIAAAPEMLAALVDAYKFRCLIYQDEDTTDNNWRKIIESATGLSIDEVLNDN